MKRLYLLSLLLLPVFLSAQSYGLVDIVTVQSPDNPAQFSVDEKGGYMVFNVQYTSSCSGKYDLEWSFSKDISTLKKGDKFTVYLECVNCNTPCGYKWTSGSASGSNNILNDPGGYGMEYNSNLKMTSSTGSVNSYSEGNLKHSFEFEAVMSKSTKFTAFYITMGGNYVYFIYEEGATSSSSGPINCHSLLGLGKLVNALEFGAYEGYPPSWMLETIDYALDHVYATGCLSPSFLEELKISMSTASSSTGFYDSIVSYSRALDTETSTSCSSCNSCE